LVVRNTPILRYNASLSLKASNKSGERPLSSDTQAVGEKLADILTRYLSANWADSPSSKKTITLNTNMVTELQLDSFQVMEFMLEVEDHYDVAIDLDSLSNIETISDLANVVIQAQQDS
jgi:acyl carrier protein